MIYNFEELSFQILTVGRYAHRAGCFEVGPRPYAAFSFRVSGSGAFEIGGTRYVTRPGDVLFLPADTPYKVEYSVSESIVVHFVRCNYCESENISVADKSLMARRFERLLEVWEQEHSVNRAKSIIYSILDSMASDRKTSISDTAVSDCIRYIDENFGDPALTVDEVCRIGFVSASSLQRAFLKLLGSSPKQYIIKLRMNRAIALLAEGELSIGEIAIACGFEDEKYFSRAFGKRFGCPPSEYRRRLMI